MHRGVMCVFRHPQVQLLVETIHSRSRGSSSQDEEKQLLTQASVILSLDSSRDNNLGSPAPQPGHPRALACSLSQIHFYKFSCLIEKKIFYVSV